MSAGYQALYWGLWEGPGSFSSLLFFHWEDASNVDILWLCPKRRLTLENTFICYHTTQGPVNISLWKVEGLKRPHSLLRHDWQLIVSRGMVTVVTFFNDGTTCFSKWHPPMLMQTTLIKLSGWYPQENRHEPRRGSVGKKHFTGQGRRLRRVRRRGNH